MNKIYSLMDASNSPYVSNILVTDIRNDINSAVTLCSCNEFGILYKETPLTRTVQAISTTTATKMSVANLTDAYGKILAENQLTIYTDKPVEVEMEVPVAVVSEISSGASGEDSISDNFDEDDVAIPPVDLQTSFVLPSNMSMKSETEKSTGKNELSPQKNQRSIANDRPEELTGIVEKNPVVYEVVDLFSGSVIDIHE
jgi:hypothetical protein